MDVPTIKELLKKYNVAPLKSLGQHFLINEQAIHKVIHIAQVTEYDTIIEIGPGLGALTRELALKAKQVVAVEIDKGFFGILKDTVGKNSNVTLINNDILRTPLSWENYKVVGNLPYNISPHILEKFLMSRAWRPSLIVVTVQKELAQRLVAKPGNTNRIGVFAQYYGKPEIIQDFPPHYFWPQPQVHSSLVRIIPKPIHNLALSPEQETRLRDMLKIAFGQPRKKLSSSLGGALGANAQTLGGKRPQETSLNDWITLASLFVK